MHENLHRIAVVDPTISDPVLCFALA